MLKELLLQILKWILLSSTFGLLYLIYAVCKKKKASSRLASIICKILNPILDRNKDGKVDEKDVPGFIDSDVDDIFPSRKEKE